MTLLPLLGLFAMASMSACGSEDVVYCNGDSPQLVRPSFWTPESHCNGVEPDYTEVFGDDIVHRIDIVITAADHQATMDDLDEICGGGVTTGDLDELPNPMWIPATVHYDGLTWTEVGMRYKGHSSLKAAWQSGVRKLSFILDFDRYEDVHPELTNQRFFGFNRLSFSNAFNDPSLIREKLAADIFRGGGVPVAQSAFYTVYLDWGEGPVYMGLYTIVEDPCDHMLETQLGDGSGNLYKPWGEAARWLSLEDIDSDDIEAHFNTCRDEDEVEHDEILPAIEALHGDRSDRARWRADLESVFDVHSFIRALAYNQVMVNWDSYGCMPHNYYVYANPADDGRLLWFPWDLNEAMLLRQQAGCPHPGSVMLDEIVYADLDHPEAEIDANWPLIRFILADPEYREDYVNELLTALDGAFDSDTVIARMERYHELIAPYVVGPAEVETYPYTNTSQDTFRESLNTGVNALRPHVLARHAAVEAALGL